MGKLSKLNLTTHRSPVESLCFRVSEHIDNARQCVQRSVDTEMLRAYWRIGRDIVEVEQQGEAKAGYGESVIKELSQKLMDRYGKGFSESNILNMRKFYIIFQIENSIPYALSTEFEIPEFKANLGWTHYRELMRVKRPEARTFYEIECS
jgi:hypothetical protein